MVERPDTFGRPPALSSSGGEERVSCWLTLCMQSAKCTHELLRLSLRLRSSPNEAYLRQPKLVEIRADANEFTRSGFRVDPQNLKRHCLVSTLTLSAFLPYLPRLLQLLSGADHYTSPAKARARRRFAELRSAKLRPSRDAIYVDNARSPRKRRACRTY